MELVETLLPGIGIRYELTTQDGQRVAIVVQREGAVEIGVYDERDLDRAIGVLRLAPEEADAVGELLGAYRTTQRFADLSREVPGLHSARMAVEPDSPFAGRPLGDTRARTLTACSIVAVVRGEDVVTAPTPAELLHAGDVLVVIGSRQGLEQLQEILLGRK